MGGVGDGQHMQRIHGKEFLAQVVRQFRRLLEERNGHGGMAAGIQQAAAFQQHANGNGGLVRIDRVEEGVGLLVAALQPDGPTQLRSELGPFIGVVAFVSGGDPEPGFGEGGVVEVPQLVKGLLIKHPKAPAQFTPAASSWALLMYREVTWLRARLVTAPPAA